MLEQREHPRHTAEYDSGARRQRKQPRPRTTLRRERVLRAIDTALTADFVVVRAAVGTGKSSAVRDWAAWKREELGHEAVIFLSPDLLWLTRDELWTEALADIGAAGSEHPLSRRQLAEQLAHTHFVVIDGVDDIVDTSVFEDLRWLIETTHLQVVGTARTHSAMERSLSHEIASTLLPPDVLNFTTDELGALLTRRGATVDAAALHVIAEGVAGWARGVNGVISELALERNRVWRASDVAPIVARVRDQLFNTLTSSLQAEWSVFLQACVLPFVSEALLRTLRAPDAHGMMRQIEDAGVGSWTRVNGRDRYQLVPLLRAVAKERFQLESVGGDPDQISSLAKLLIESGSHPWEAVQLAASAGQNDLMSRLCRQHYAAVARDHHHALLQLLSSRSVAPALSDPWLAYLKTALEMALPGKPAASTAVELKRIESMLRGTVALPDQRSSIEPLLLRGVIARQTGNFGRADTLARTLLESTPQSVAGQTMEIPAEATVQSGISLLTNGALQEALGEFGRARMRTETPGHLRIQSLGYTALIHAINGDMQAARRLVEATHKADEWVPWRHSMWAVPTHVAAAMAAIDALDWRRAEQHMRTLSMLRIATEDWPYITLVQAWAALVRGDGYGAFSIIRDAEGTYGQSRESNFVQGLLFVLKSDSLLMARQAKTALAALRPFLDGRDPIVGAYARALLLSGNPSHARVFVDRGVWRSRLSPRSLAELHVVKAIASARLKDLDGARISLEQAVEVTSNHHLASPWWMVPGDELRNLFEQFDLTVPKSVATAPAIFDSGLTVPVLTRRETVVLSLLREPGSIDAIAAQLGVSPNTVKSQVQSLYRKLGVKTRAEAVRVAREWQLFDETRARSTA